VGLITRPRSSRTECGVSECDREASIMTRPWPTRGLLHRGEKICCTATVQVLCEVTCRVFRLNIRGKLAQFVFPLHVVARCDSRITHCQYNCERAVIVSIAPKLYSGISFSPDECLATWRRGVPELDMPFAMFHSTELHC
jgi:hypothetical protein